MKDVSIQFAGNVFQIVKTQTPGGHAASKFERKASITSGYVTYSPFGLRDLVGLWMACARLAFRLSREAMRIEPVLVSEGEEVAQDDDNA